MLILVICFLASVLLTAVARIYLVRCGVVDIPNSRSSHKVATPRGGGISIAVVFLLAVLLLLRANVISMSLARALIGGGLAVSVTGLVDDRFGLPARLRLKIHFAAAAWALWQLHGIGPLYLGRVILDWGWAGQLVALLGLVWMINLYNFMDGLDGLAGSEAVYAGGLGGLLLAYNGLGGLAACVLALAGAGAGFLVWNWPPARIFMGDVGSGFLGFVFGVVAISSAKERPWLLWAWFILLAVFIVDSTLTLSRRLISGARWNEAHCHHAYQHAARQMGRHSKVTLTIAALNAAWLFPLAWGTCAWPGLGPLFALLAVAPLAYVAFRYHAGQAADADG